jgi:hypothetical protein
MRDHFGRARHGVPKTTEGIRDVKTHAARIPCRVREISRDEEPRSRTEAVVTCFAREDTLRERAV